MKISKNIYLIILLVSLISHGFSQQKITVKGNINNSKNGEAVPFALLVIEGKPTEGTQSSLYGDYTITTDYEDSITLQISCLGYEPLSVLVNTKVDPGGNKVITRNIKLNPATREIEEVSIKRTRATNLTKIDARVAAIIPSVSGSLENLLQLLPGVSSSSELSSQYSVRGGNFDENLVYVNDIEIYRPFLVRSGNQEGLSFINPDMVSSVLFSSGGFDAKFGDKLSSVLDIKYKKPEIFAGSASMSFLGGSVHFESVSSNRRFTQISGLRYKTTKYLLKSMETKGEYKPSFTDFQTYMTYDVSEKLELSFLGNFAMNQYNFFPEDRETSFGTYNEALKLKIYFDGSEEDKFTTMLGALSAKYNPSEKLTLKFIGSVFQTIEEETFDIMGQYWLNELDSQLGSDSFADSIMNIGVGTFLNHARNNLSARVSSLEHKGFYDTKNNLFQWGLKYQQESFIDNISEWEMQDSAGYSLPYSEDTVFLNKIFISGFEQNSRRVSAYIQDTYTGKIKSGELILTAGMRANYLDLNKQFTFSPRVSLSYHPDWNKDILFRFASGYYHQPPFFKELKNLYGQLNKNVKAQESIHFVAGSDLNFFIWNRPFKFVSEIYYKQLNNLIPYEVDNVRIRYFGDNVSHGYASGIDLRINGEFVKGVDSWFSLSVMQTKEDIEGDNRGYLRRPTDQLVNLGVFFQDYFPGNRSYKMHLNLMYGSGLPTGKPGNAESRSRIRIPAYKRVDLGFSKVIKSEDNLDPGFKLFKHIKSLWLSLEVFNLLQIENTISYIWIKDVRNINYAVPNYLTSRRINLKLSGRF